MNATPNLAHHFDRLRKHAAAVDAKRNATTPHELEVLECDLRLLDQVVGDLRSLIGRTRGWR